MIIPKKIHYIWVGPNKLSKLEKKCIESWKSNLPEYELIFWDEKNIPLDNFYVKEMISRKKWAFVADYVRFLALYEHGGVYLDTDMEVLKNLDPLLDSDQCFFGMTSSDNYISCGIIGSSLKNLNIKIILDYYDAIKNFDNPETSPEIVTKLMLNSDIKVYDPAFFYPCNAGCKCTNDKLVNAFTNHHWSESWVKYRIIRKFLRKIGILKKIKKYGSISHKSRKK